MVSIGLGNKICNERQDFLCFHATFSLENEEIIYFAKIEFDMLIMIRLIILICIVQMILSKSHLYLRTLVVVLLFKYIYMDLFLSNRGLIEIY